MLAFGTQVRGFKPDRSRWIFQGEKILSTSSFGGEVKPSVPCRRFTACKRSLNFRWKSGIFRQNSSAISRPSCSSFHYYGLWWRHLAMQVGKTKDQGLYNKSLAAVHPGALATGTLPQYNTMYSCWNHSPVKSVVMGNWCVCCVCVCVRVFTNRWCNSVTRCSALQNVVYVPHTYLPLFLRPFETIFLSACLITALCRHIFTFVPGNSSATSSNHLSLGLPILLLPYIAILTASWLLFRGPYLICVLSMPNLPF